MKNVLLSSLMFLFSAICVNAQTPQFTFTGTGSINSFPFNSTSSNRVQWLYNQSQFIPVLQSGLISRIYVRAMTSTTTTLTNLTISIGHTTITTMPSGGGVWATGLTTCRATPTTTLTTVNGQWLALDLTTPFFYDGVSNLIVDISQTGYTSGFSIQQNSATGNRRQWGGALSATISGSGTGQAELGIDLIPGSPSCTRPTSTPATNINSVSARVNWNAVPGSVMYEYVIDTTTPGRVYQTILSTTATNAFVSGLIPNKQHYVRVRNYCSPTVFSFWDTIGFVTLPPCNRVPDVVVAYVDSNNARLQWDTASNVVGWRFLVDTIRANPANNNPGIQNTTNRFPSLTNLKEGRWYYVHLKTRCIQNDSSAWALDSFYTPTPCRRPLLQLSHISHNNAVVYWAPVKTVVNYEYFIGNVADIPPFGGTPTVTPSLQTSALQAGKPYSLHVRCNCSDNGIKTSSGWSSIDYTTNPPLSVANTTAESLLLETYPNPVKDNLTIKLNRAAIGKATIQITDVKGAVVKTADATTGAMQVNVANLAPGVYLLQYTDAEQSITTRFTKE